MLQNGDALALFARSARRTLSALHAALAATAARVTLGVNANRHTILKSLMVTSLMTG